MHTNQPMEVEVLMSIKAPSSVFWIRKNFMFPTGIWDIGA